MCINAHIFYYAHASMGMVHASECACICAHLDTELLSHIHIKRTCVYTWMCLCMCILIY